MSYLAGLYGRSRRRNDDWGGIQEALMVAGPQTPYGPNGPVPSSSQQLSGLRGLPSDRSVYRSPGASDWTDRWYSEPIEGQPSYRAYNRLERWWEEPNVSFLAPGAYPLRGTDVRSAMISTPRGGRVTFQPEVPDWAAGQFTDPADFYEWWQRLSREEQERVKPALAAANMARIQEQQGRERGIAELRGAQGTLQERLNEFLENARWNTLVESIERRARGEDPVISSEELALQRLTLGQRYAQTEAAARAEAAGRGVAGGGAIKQRLEPMRAYTDVGGLQLAAHAKAANRMAQVQADADLARVLTGREGVVLAYQNELRNISSQIAELEAGGRYEPTDMLAFDELSWAMDMYEQMLDQATAAHQAYEEEAGYTLQEFGIDLASRVLPWAFLS